MSLTKVTNSMIQGASISVMDFGAKGDGVTDDTAAIQAAFTYFSTQMYGGSMVFPKGNYITKSQIVFTDVYWKTIIFEGALICGQSDSASYDAVFKIVNAQNTKFVGSWTVTADSSAFGSVNDPNKYDCAFSIQAAPGGTIEPVNGIVNFVDVYGLTVTKVKRGVTIGAYDSDAQVAELVFHGLMTPFCPNPVYSGGSQTVTTFVGGSTASSPWPAITSPVYASFIIEGGAVSVVGGELTQHTPAAGVVVDLRPASTVAFSNPYGTFTASATLIEQDWGFAKINNPRALLTPTSNTSKLSLSGCYGYSGGMPAGTAYISVDDVAYAGKIAIDEACKFYQNIGSTTRSGATINCSTAPNTTVTVGRTSFASGYPYWMTGVSGGQLIHNMEWAIQAFVNSGTLASGGANLKPTVFNTDSRFQRYSSIYDLTTGIITIPSNLSVKNMRVEANLITGAVTGDIYLYDITNSRIMGFGQISGGAGNLVCTIGSFTAGQQFAIVLNVSGPVTFSGSVTNAVNIYIGNEM